MEADTVKKILVYSVVALVLGLTLVLIPLIALAGIKAENDYAMGRSLFQQLEQLEGTHDLDAPKFTTSDVKILAFAFVIALVVYMVFKHGISHHDYRWGRPFLY
jgi:Mn2+/Fe2+ NRAMP family transporter